ncbi:MAG: hypothetical protein ACYC4L_12150 [Chloroflexota bacterium]
MERGQSFTGGIAVATGAASGGGLRTASALAELGAAVAHGNPGEPLTPAVAISPPPGGPLARPWRRLAATAVKALHTAIFGTIAACVVYTFWCGVRNRPTRWTAPAILVVLVESAVFAGNGWRCPLTGLAEELGAESGRVTDIFLPRWFADRIPQFFTPPFVVGLLALCWHRWPARRGRQG